MVLGDADLECGLGICCDLPSNVMDSGAEDPIVMELEVDRRDVGFRLPFRI